MRTIATQKWLTDFVLPIISIAIVSLSAVAVWRQRWFRVRPVLSAYICFAAATGTLTLIVFYSQQVCSGTLQYALCRIYLVGFHVVSVLTYLFHIAVVYEFLFRMAGADKRIRRTAIIGFLIAVSFTIAFTYTLIKVDSTKPNPLEDSTRFLFGATALALVASGVVIFAIKKKRSLFLDARLSLVLASVVLYEFIDLISAYMMRRNDQARLVVGDLIWIAFAILLYWGVQNGPAISCADADLNPSS